MTKLGSAFVAVVLLATAELAGQSSGPRIRQLGVRNAESLAPANVGSLPFPATGLAPGSLFVVQGFGLGPEELVVAQAPFPTQLPADGGSRVSIRSLAGGEVFEALLVHGWTYQVGGIVPSAVPAGPAEFTASYHGADSDPVAVEIVESGPGIFAISQDGFGPGVIQNYESPGSQPLNSLTRPASPGQFLILWGTGLGAVEGDDNAPPVGNVLDDVTVRIGERLILPAAYAGRAPGLPGVDQINVQLPDDERLVEGCYVPLSASAGDAFSRQVSVAISSTPGRCEHPLGLKDEKLVELDAGGTATIVSLNVSDIEFPSIPGLAIRQFRPFASADVAAANATGVAQRGNRVTRVPASRAACGRDAVWITTGVFSVIDDVPPPPLTPATAFPVDLGGAVELAGPDGRLLELVAFDPGTSYAPRETLEPDFFTPGEWRLRFQGGADVAAAEVPFRIPPHFDLETPEVVRRGEDLELTWRSEDYLPGETAQALLSVTYREPGAPGDTSRRDAIGCRGPAILVRFGIAASDIDALEVPEGAEVEWSFGLITGPAAFTAEGVDYGRVDYSYTRRRATTIE